VALSYQQNGFGQFVAPKMFLNAAKSTLFGMRRCEFIRLPWLVGRVVGPLLAARALPLRFAASTVLSSALLAI
jgi:hypothetical protein